MKKLALIMTFMILITTLLAPMTSAAPASEASGVSSGASSGASSSAASDEKQSKADSKNESKTPSGASSGEESPASSSASTGGSASVNSPSRYPPPFADELQSKAIYMLNVDSGQVVYEKNAQQRMYPASITKVMTCIVALENVKDLDGETTALKASIQNELYNLKVDTLGGIYMGEQLSIRDLIYAMMLQSANEAAMMVADYVGDGSIELFCEMMNKKAKEIGALNTNFSNATGLHDENNYSTAYDLALIVKYAMSKPEFAEIVTTKSYTSQPTAKYPNGITWYSINEMQKTSSEDYYEGLRGVKTGTLPEVNLRNFASTATRNGYTYLLVVLDAPIKREDDGKRFQYNLSFVDTKKLYDWAFNSFTVKTLMSVGEEVSEVPVKLSWDVDHVKLLAAEKFASLVPNEVTAETIVPIPEIPEYVNAPIKKGATIGYARLMLSGEEVGRVKLVAAESVEQSKALFYLDKVKAFFSTFLFKFISAFVIVILVLYIVLMVIRNRNMRRYQSRRRRPPTAKR